MSALLEALVGGGMFSLGAFGMAPLWVRSGRQAERRERANECPHAWGLWQECSLHDGWRWGNNGERIDEYIVGQKRECTMCGQRQVRNVEAPRK